MWNGERRNRTTPPDQKTVLLGPEATGETQSRGHRSRSLDESCSSLAPQWPVRTRKTLSSTSWTLGFLTKTTRTTSSQTFSKLHADSFLIHEMTTSPRLKGMQSTLSPVVPNIWFIAIAPWNKQYMKVAILHSCTATCIIQSPRLLALRVVDPILFYRLSFRCQHCILRKLQTLDTVYLLHMFSRVFIPWLLV
jgi:hypothetical protein